MPLWMLNKAAEIDGTHRGAGYVFERPDDWTPPMDTVRDPENPSQFKDIPAAAKLKDDAQAILQRRADTAAAEQEALGPVFGQEPGLHPLPPDHPVAVQATHDAAEAAAIEQEPIEDTEPAEGKQPPEETQPAPEAAKN